MNKYNKQARCPKCGNDWIGTEYDDHICKMIRKCGGCGFQWLEEPLDTLTPKNNEDKN